MMLSPAWAWTVSSSESPMAMSAAYAPGEKRKMPGNNANIINLRIILFIFITDSEHMIQIKKRLGLGSPNLFSLSKNC
jgi:hypothetical protein